MENYSPLQTNILFIGQLVSVFISSVTLIVLLWQTKYPYRKKLKVHFKIAKSLSNKSCKSNEFIGIFIATNTGNRDINIEEFGIMNSKNKVIIKIDDFCLTELHPITKNIRKLPLKLNTQSKILVAYSLDEIINHINITSFTNDTDYKKIKIYFKDSVGKATKKFIDRKKNRLLYSKLKDRFKSKTKDAIIKNKSNKEIIQITVTWYNNEKGYGFGRTKKDDFEIFFHKSSVIENIDHIYEGDNISITMLDS